MFEVVFETFNALDIGLDLSKVLDVLVFGLGDRVLEFFHLEGVVFEDDLGDGFSVFGTYEFINIDKYLPTA